VEVAPCTETLAAAAGMAKRVYPHRFRHQLLTSLTTYGIIRPTLQLLSGQMAEQRLTISRALADVAEAMQRPCRLFRTIEGYVTSYGSLPPLDPSWHRPRRVMRRTRVSEGGSHVPCLLQRVNRSFVRHHQL
jgi:hypothetical protein